MMPTWLQHRLAQTEVSTASCTKTYVSPIVRTLLRTLLQKSAPHAYSFVGCVLCMFVCGVSHARTCRKLSNSFWALGDPSQSDVFRNVAHRIRSLAKKFGRGSSTTSVMIEPLSEHIRRTDNNPG